jgi:ribosomal protein S18 acetylase RimI-like enzyme
MDGLMIGRRECGAASLLLSETVAVPEEMRSGIRELSSMVTNPDKRKQGHADALLHTVCYEADKNGIVLLLTVKSSGEMSDKNLIKLYKKHGFQEMPNKPDNPILMARQAHG